MRIISQIPKIVFAEVVFFVVVFVVVVFFVVVFVVVVYVVVVFVVVVFFVFFLVMVLFLHICISKKVMVCAYNSTNTQFRKTVFDDQKCLTFSVLRLCFAKEGKL